MYNLYNAEAQFKKYLIAGNISQVSIRNYLSDFRYFYGWYQNSFKGSSLIEDLQRNPDIQIQYKSFLIRSNSAISTVKRRLSSIQKFYMGLHKEGILNSFTYHTHSEKAISSDIKPKVTQPGTEILDLFKYDLLMNERSTMQVDAIISSVSELFIVNEAK